MWGGCVVFCDGEPRFLWLVFVGGCLWVYGGFILSMGILVGVLLRGFVGFQPRLWRLCGGWGCVRVDLWRCIGSDCGRMSG